MNGEGGNWHPSDIHMRIPSHKNVKTVASINLRNSSDANSSLVSSCF